MNLAVLQARMSSSRLPGKVMAPVLGAPMIGRQVERLRRSRALDQLVVATSVDPSDDPLAAWCEGADVAVFRGDLADVLGRFCGALAACLAANMDLREAVEQANAAAALSVQKAGAAPSMPSRREVEVFLGL